MHMDNRVWSHQSSRNPVITTLRVTQLRATRATWAVMSVLIKTGKKIETSEKSPFLFEALCKRCCLLRRTSIWTCCLVVQYNLPNFFSPIPSFLGVFPVADDMERFPGGACRRGYILRFSAGPPAQRRLYQVGSAPSVPAPSPRGRVSRPSALHFLLPGLLAVSVRSS